MSMNTREQACQDIITKGWAGHELGGQLWEKPVVLPGVSSGAIPPVHLYYTTA